jgi:hypothetical protein
MRFGFADRTTPRAPGRFEDCQSRLRGVTTGNRTRPCWATSSRAHLYTLATASKRAGFAQGRAAERPPHESDARTSTRSHERVRVAGFEPALACSRSKWSPLTHTRKNRRRGPGGTRTLTSRVSTERSTFELPDRLSRHTPQTRHRASSGIRTRTPGFGRPGPYRWTMLAIPDAPALLAWSSRRAEWSRSRESNPSSPSYQEGVVPRRPERQELEVAYCLAATGGLEPPSHRLTGGRSSIELRRKNWMKQKEAGRGERVA